MFCLSQLKSYFFVEHDFMKAYCNAYYRIILYNNFVRIFLLFNYVSLRLSYLSHTHRLIGIVCGNINYKSKTHFKENLIGKRL